MGHEQKVRKYYCCLDQGCYQSLRQLLGPDFKQQRPDRSFYSSDEFIAYMREERPLTDTVHRLETVDVIKGDVRVQGHLEHKDGDVLFRFQDQFEFDTEDRIRRIHTSIR